MVPLKARPHRAAWGLPAPARMRHSLRIVLGLSRVIRGCWDLAVTLRASEVAADCWGAEVPIRSQAVCCLCGPSCPAGLAALQPLAPGLMSGPPSREALLANRPLRRARFQPRACWSMLWTGMLGAGGQWLGGAGAPRCLGLAVQPGVPCRWLKAPTPSSVQRPWRETALSLFPAVLPPARGSPQPSPPGCPCSH